MLFSELCRLAKIKLDERYCDIEISGISSDSRRVSDGYLYVCIKGASFDGHDFINSAIERGAVALVCDCGYDASELPDGIAVIYSHNTRKTMAYLFSAWYNNPQDTMKIIGVTGTNGKTTVSRMIYEILYRSGRRVGLIGTVGSLYCGAKIDIRSECELSNLTTPDPEELYKIFDVMKKSGAEYIVMEVSSHALAHSKVAPINFEVGIFTNLTPEHLDFHGDMEAYFQAKAGLFDKCNKAVINCDNPYGVRLAGMYRDKAITCSAQSGDTSVCAEQIVLDRHGIEYKLSHPRLRARIICAIPGAFTVMNSLEATVCAYELGVSASDIKGALAHLSGIEGRLERVRLDKSLNFSVYIDYAHTPDALENLLRTARGFSSRRQRIVLLFGCGGDRDRSKRAQMGRIASSMADFVIITSDNSRSENKTDIICEILSGVDKESCFTVIEDREDAIEYAIKNAKENDLILLAGKGHENYEIDRSGKRYFCERDLVLKYARKYHLGDI